jgi:heme/copper-type cytochrome/quinol oxidase subunit 1
MQLSAPKLITWWLALIIGALGVIANFVTLPVLSGLAFWLVVVGLVLLLLATILEGL